MDDASWSEYKDGLRMRLSACRAVAGICGILIAVSRLQPIDAATAGAGALLLFVAILIAVYLEVISGWSLTVLAGRRVRGLQRVLLFPWVIRCPMKAAPNSVDQGSGEDESQSNKEVEDVSVFAARRSIARRLDAAAWTLGAAEYVIAGWGVLTILLPTTIIAGWAVQLRTLLPF